MELFAGKDMWWARIDFRLTKLYIQSPKRVASYYVPVNTICWRRKVHIARAVIGDFNYRLGGAIDQ